MFVAAIASLAERDLFSSSSPTLLRASRHRADLALLLHLRPPFIRTNAPRSTITPPATPRIDRYVIAQNAASDHRIFRQRCQAT
jgi:hypothetical protein